MRRSTRSWRPPGRLSSSDPNLQNIPVRTRKRARNSLGVRARAEGWKLLAADYSQIELRVLAHFSQRPDAVRGLCQRDEDIHARVASQVYGVPLDRGDAPRCGAAPRRSISA